MRHQSTLNCSFKVIACAIFVALLSSCTVVKVVDTAASATIGVAKTAVKTTGKVAGAAIPDGDDKKEKKEKKKNK